MPAGVVSQIWRFPVKSMRGKRITTGFVSETGLLGDRRWGVVDAATGKVLSAKREARLMEARAIQGDAEGPPVVELPDGHHFPADDPEAGEILSAWLGRAVRLEQADPAKRTGYEMNVDNTDEGSPVVEIPCPPGTFLDAGAVHLLTTASMATAASHHPEGLWDARRFRPTVLVDLDAPGWPEDAWIGNEVTVGDARFFVFAPTVRCAMTTRAQEELPADTAIASTVNREHGANLGVYCAVRTEGAVTVGDPVEVSSP